MNTQAQGLLFLSGPEVQPLRDVLNELIAYPEVSRHFAAMVSGLEIRYDLDGGSHPLLGRRLPEVKLTGDRLVASSTEALHAARGVLLDLTDNEALRRRATPWLDRVDVVTAAPVLPEGSALEGTTSTTSSPAASARPRSGSIASACGNFAPGR